MRNIIIALFLLFGMAVGALAADQPHMATKPMTEQYILGAMMQKLLEASGLMLDITYGVGGGTANIQPALEKGEFDFYPEYTGTAWSNVLKKDGLYSEAMFDQLQTAYKKLGLLWRGLPGFNNTFGIAVRKEIADKYKLKNISDLAPVANKLKFGAEYDFFEREDGFDALCELYGLKFKNTRDMDIGLKYAAIRQNEIDVMNIFTTDGQLASSDVVLLKDDKGLFPSYACGFVVREDSLKKFPQLEEAFKKISGQISDAEMSGLNNEVESLDEDPEEAALHFLKRKRLLP